MANELTLSPTVASGDGTSAYVSQIAGQGVVYRQFTGVAANGTSTQVEAAGGALTRHVIVGIMVDVDTAGETLAIISGSTTLATLRFPTPDLYVIRFPVPLECGINEALNLDKGTVAAINGRIWYIEAAASGRMVNI